MPDTVPPATSTAPAPEAQTSDAKQGASNLTASEMVRRFLEPTPTKEATADQTTPEAPATETPELPAAETEQPAPAEAQPEEAEPAVTDTAEPEAKEEADDVLSQKSSLDQKTKERIQRRIDKEVGKRKALEAKLAELESKLTQQPAQPKAPDEKPQVVPLPEGAPPLANIESPEGLVSLQKQAKEAARWAEELLDTDAIEQGNGIQVGDKVLTKADLKAILRNAKVTLEDHIPARQAFLQQRAHWAQTAQTLLPSLKDKTSTEYQVVQAIYAEKPWLKNDPTGDWTAGLIAKGWLALQAEQSAAQAKAKAPVKPKVEAPKPPSSQTAVSASSTVRQPSEPKAPSLRDAAKAKGGVSGSELAAFLARKELARNSA